jgi:4-amino-4-deoxy-L-arabinose transferase-like glycosyltransferase
MLAGLGAADCKFHMEVRSLASSQETWLRQQSDPHAWILPSWNGAPRVNKPPLLVWINLLAWSGLPPDTPVAALILRARYAAVFAAMLALLATAWAGTTLGGSRLGFSAAAVTGNSFFFLRQARLASYDTYLLAFCALAMAAGVWALQPGHPELRRPRHRWGWALAGLALGAAVLVKGPLALLLVGGPLLALSLSDPERRRHALGLLIMLTVTALVVLPWYVHILLHVPDALPRLATELESRRESPHPPWYYLGLIGLMLPWCLWLPVAVVGGLRRRFNTQPGATRTALIWFLLIFVLLSLHEAKQQRYIAPILPAAGLLVALALLHPGSEKNLRRLAAAHFGLLSLLTLALGLLGGGQAWWLARGWMKQPMFGPLPAWIFIALTPALLLLAAGGYRLLLRQKREAALWLTAGWMSLAATPALYAYAQAPHVQYAHREAVTRVGELTRGQPFFHLTGNYTTPQYVHPDPRFLLYARRVVPGLDLDHIKQLAGPAWVTAPVHDKADRELKRAGWTAVLDYRDQGPLRRLYRREG